jgi:hypothetical protein
MGVISLTVAVMIKQWKSYFKLKSYFVPIIHRELKSEISSKCGTAKINDRLRFKEQMILNKSGGEVELGFRIDRQYSSFIQSNLLIEVWLITVVCLFVSRPSVLLLTYFIKYKSHLLKAINAYSRTMCADNLYDSLYINTVVTCMFIL